MVLETVQFVAGIGIVDILVASVLYEDEDVFMVLPVVSSQRLYNAALWAPLNALAVDVEGVA